MPDVKELGIPISDVAPDKDDFMEKLELLQLSRERITNNENNVLNRIEVDRQTKNKIENIDPKMLYQPITKPESNPQSNNLARREWFVGSISK